MAELNELSKESSLYHDFNCFDIEPNVNLSNIAFTIPYANSGSEKLWV